MALRARKVVSAVKELMNDDMNDERRHIDEIIESFRGENTAETEMLRLVSKIREENGKGHEKEQELIGRVLLVASDAQTVTGISLSQYCILMLTFCRRNCLDHHRNGPAAVFKSLPSTHHI